MSNVRFSQVKKSYGPVDVIHDFNLEINDGEFVSFLGPSGCGKTTCLRMVAGLEKNSGGTISIEEELVSDPDHGLFVAPERRHVGMVFQSYAVWPHMNVSKNVGYPLRVAGIPKKERADRVAAVLKLVELNGLENRMPNQLSGGQQQRVALARGLVMEPRVLLLDEPLSNLDAKLRGKMRSDIRRIQQELKITVIYVTHDQVEATSMSDRMVIMKDGRILQVGTPDEVRDQPANDFVADFLRQ